MITAKSMLGGEPEQMAEISQNFKYILILVFYAIRETN